MTYPGGAESGQALIEFLLACLLALAAICGSSLILNAAWEKEKCLILAYERLRSAMNDENGAGLRHGVIEDRGKSLRITSRCGSTRERLELKKLEAVQL